MRSSGLMLLALAMTGCASVPSIPAPPFLNGNNDGVREAHLSDDIAVRLPMPPAYPETRVLMQTVRAQYGDQRQAFEALLSLSPDEVEIVVTAASGPRLSTIRWDRAGVHEDRTLLVPQGMPVENILGDLFVTLWPRDAVAHALPDGVEVREETGGGRTILAANTPLIEVRPVEGHEDQETVRNFARNYVLTITSRPIQ
ncbi:MAG: DUF3261 domain-containing protein [Caulobacterales bacterium]